MSVLFSAVSPGDGDINVPLNAEVVFRMIKTVGSLDLSSLNVILDNGVLVEEPIIGGVFSNGFDGEYIDNSGAQDLSDVTVVIIRPSDEPEYPQGQRITVGVNVDLV